MNRRPAGHVSVSILVLACLLLMQPMAAFARPLPPDELAGAEPAQQTLAATPASVLRPESPDATLKWYTIAGAGFIPYTNALTWDYGGSGCLAPNVAGFWRANINLPDGAIMKQIYFGFSNDADSTTSTAYIYRYNYLGAATTVVQVNSTAGSAGTGYKFTSAIIATPGETITNYTNAYMFAWSGSPSQELCYIQVGYSPPPLYGTFMPRLAH